MFPYEREEAATKIKQTLFSRPEFQESKTIGFYLAIGTEVPTKEMIEEAQKLGKQITVPVTNESIEFCKFTSFEDLAPAKYGILEPREKQPLEPDLIIVPGIAFGECMHRIGYGKGYYDDYLSKKPVRRIGICYDFQLLEKLPSHHTDVPMDEIITEKRLIK